MIERRMRIYLCCCFFLVYSMGKCRSTRSEKSFRLKNFLPMISKNLKALNNAWKIEEIKGRVIMKVHRRLESIVDSL